MKPTIVNEVSHFPVAADFEAYLATGGQTVVRVILIVSVGVSVLADALSVLSLVFELIADVSE
jgi:hypothetical protein